jgi:hypothetical protein
MKKIAKMLIKRNGIRKTTPIEFFVMKLEM